MEKLKVSIFLILFILAPAASQTSVSEKEAKVDKIFAAWNKPKIPGAAVAVVQDGKPLLIKGYGCANLEYNIPITTKTPFNAASLAKQFTAFAVLMLEEQGKLSLDDEVRTYILEFPDFGFKITIRHLLYHTSGLRDYGGLILMSGNRMDDVITSNAILKIIFGQKELNFEPGTETAYCNATYNLLAEIVARTSGQSFSEWTRKNIFIPLGMEKAIFKEIIGEILPGAAQSYTPSGEGDFLQVPDNEAAPGPGSLFLSIEDMAQWMAALQRKSIGTQSAWAKMFETGKLSDGRDLPFAAGLIAGSYKRLPIFFHSGRWAGYRGDMVYFPEQNIAVTVFTNNSSINPSQISRQIVDIFLEGLFPKSRPESSPEVEVGSEILDAYTGRYWLRGEQTIMIARKDNTLFAQISGDFPIKLFAETDDTFAYKIVDAKIQFHRIDSAKAHKITFWQGAYAVSAERLPDEEWSPSALDEFSGLYYSDELGSVLEVKAGENGLYMPFIRRGDLLLVPLAKDRFAGQNSSLKIRFTRSSDGAIKELFFSLLDAWNVRFTRIVK